MILITGATGLVGAHIALQLIEKGNRVRAIYRTTSSIDKTRAYFDYYQKSALFTQIDWLEADILDIPLLEIAFENVDLVYHCAAFISYDPQDEEQIRKTNIEGTANIVNFCLSKNVNKLCYISSIAALGDKAPHENTISETTEWNPEKPHSDYAISKYGAEMEVWRGQQEGLDVVVVNPGLIFGPFIKTITDGSAGIYHKVAKGLSFYTMGSTGCVVVDDVANIAIMLMNSEIKNERFTLIENNYPFKTIFDAIASALKVKKPRIHADPSLMNIIWRIDWLLSKILNKKRQISKATAKASSSKNTFSNEKIKTRLDYTFTNVTNYIQTNVIQ
ncbi:NAD-dependent epimerase/dehydratase family protein [Flavobacterium agrisoli]|uniref:NAD-dependent epimerase/dehydratase family protein n=1 Tax=Flavobacterium agrisoli TaxID=2793066 RepID=A0A934PQJ4_9FLAO|nr:NAD-dependent epimerase/dehydratase family protein [Flavobacterium agrisoli]MBK0371074.1 NAD-dependent epimerase/dehydratase family protein [Flavobacterium agrisoli]